MTGPTSLRGRSLRNHQPWCPYVVCGSIKNTTSVPQNGATDPTEDIKKFVTRDPSLTSSPLLNHWTLGKSNVENRTRVFGRVPTNPGVIRVTPGGFHLGRNSFTPNPFSTLRGEELTSESLESVSSSVTPRPTLYDYGTRRTLPSGD